MWVILTTYKSWDDPPSGLWTQDIFVEWPFNGLIFWDAKRESETPPDKPVTTRLTAYRFLGPPEIQSLTDSFMP